jgi:hypothetical protein
MRLTAVAPARSVQENIRADLSAVRQDVIQARPDPGTGRLIALRRRFNPRENRLNPAGQRQ